MTILRSVLCLSLLLPAVLTSEAARADSFVVTYGAAGVESADTALLCAGTTVCVVGQQKFTGSFNGQTDYGTSGAIAGAYTGDYGVVNATQYGGAQGLETYLATFSNTGYTITLTHSASVPGVNYFGFWLSALDSGNQLEVLRDGAVVGIYTPADLRAAVGSHPAYFGNPSGTFAGQDVQEPFAFVNFFDLTGYFDQIKIFEAPLIGGYESDNQTVGLFTKVSAASAVVEAPLPLPGASPFAFAALAAGLVAAHRRRAGVPSGAFERAAAI